MARWSEEQERWMGRGDRWGEDERRLREERGEEGAWRGRDWRDESPERWRGAERGEWREPGRGRYMEGEGEWGRDLGERRRREEGYERWRAEPGRGRDWERWSQGGREPYSAGGRGAWGDYGEHSTYGSSAGGWGYGRDESRRDFGRDYGRDWRRGGREERGPMERFGEKLKEGVRKLTGRGPKGYRRSDDRIRDDVSEQIARSWVNAENVEVKVEGGEVTLTGFVESREEKRAIEDVAEDVFGVEEVHNHLRLNRAGQTAGQTSLPAGTGTTGTGAAMSAQQARPGASQPHQTGRH
jgi:hypothetical protein